MLTHTRLVAMVFAAFCFWAPLSVSLAQPIGARTSTLPREVVVDATAEVALLGMANAERAQYDLPALKMSLTLRKLARDHSREMANRGYVGHDSPSGGSFLDRLASAVPPGTWVGENVAAVQTVDQANAVFVASALHLRNILDRNFHSAGIGIVTVNEIMVVTEDFAQ